MASAIRPSVCQVRCLWQPREFFEFPKPQAGTNFSKGDSCIGRGIEFEDRAGG